MLIAYCSVISIKFIHKYKNLILFFIAKYDEYSVFEEKVFRSHTDLAWIGRLRYIKWLFYENRALFVKHYFKILLFIRNNR